jgi:uncharacterized protein (DUF362 family)
MSRAFIGRMGEGGMSPVDVRRALEWLDWERIVPEGARVFVKPNLTWPEHRPGVTTTPQAMEAVLAVLRERTPRITLGESNGGYHSFAAEEAFRGHGLPALAEHYGIRLVNLSKLPAETLEMEIGGRAVAVTLPGLLLHEVDVFLTLPVPKARVMTGVSLAFKNQWGCISSTMRLREHPEFDRKIIAINKALRSQLAILDGMYFLDGAGPLTGEAVKRNLLIAADGPGAASAVACRIMGISPESIAHFRIAEREGLFPMDLRGVVFNASPDEFRGRTFRMKRAVMDWISLAGFRNRILSRIFWDLPSAGPLHGLLYALRRNGAVARLLYGKAGPPPNPKQEIPPIRLKK